MQMLNYIGKFGSQIAQNAFHKIRGTYHGTIYTQELTTKHEPEMDSVVIGFWHILRGKGQLHHIIIDTG